jgi:glycosyltransferase involved in cell wall biosynthesis
LKKVLYISYDGMTDPLGQSQVLPYLTGLSLEGYSFTLLSFEKKDRFKKNRSVIEKITAAAGITWVPMFFTARPPVLSKLYDQYRLLRKAKELHAAENFSLIHCRSYVAAAAGLKLQQTKGVPFLFDMRGFWVDERVDNGQWNLSNPLYRFAYNRYKMKELRYFNGAAHIISLTHKGKEEMVNRYKVPAGKITVIPCCADLAHFDYHRVSDQEKIATRTRLGISADERVLCYLGSLGGWYMTGEMLDFFKVLQQTEPRAKFLFITHDKREGILAAAAAKGIDGSAIITIPASRAEVPALLAVCNWSVFFIKDAYSKKASSPTKQGEIIAMGIPVICNDIGDTGRIVEENGAGIVINEFTEQVYREAASQASALLKIDREKVRQGAVACYDLRHGVNSYLGVYQQLIS